MRMEYFDVSKMEDLPAPPQGFRYFDFIGGSKELRCFLVHEDTPRGLFIEENEHLLDPCLQPIFKNNGICVRQDPSFPTPGFYIVSPTRNFRFFDEIDEVTHLRMSHVIREIRKGMREALGIQYIYLYYEEKAKKSNNVHYWLVPLYHIDSRTRIYNFKVKEYLEKFVFSDERKKILDFNQKMRNYLEKVKLLEKDQKLLERLSDF